MTYYDGKIYEVTAFRSDGTSISTDPRKMQKLPVLKKDADRTYYLDFPVTP